MDKTNQNLQSQRNHEPTPSVKTHPLQKSPDHAPRQFHKNPDYTGPRSPIVHSYNRRAFFHDYTVPCIYMFTIRKADNAPMFSKVVGTPHPKNGPTDNNPENSSVSFLVQIRLDYTGGDLKDIKNQSLSVGNLQVCDNA